jgi:hypothetical protein
MRASFPILPPLTSDQQALVGMPADSKIFLEGPAGCGKTTAGAHRLLHLLDCGESPHSILILLPQRTLSEPYFQALLRTSTVSGGSVSILTMGGLAQRMIDLFWPVVSEAAGFARPDAPPTFLTLETAQYYMARLVRPLLEQGMFDGVTIDRNRLYSQIVDNLNKAAVVGFPYTEVGQRLSLSLPGDPAQVRVYEDAQECANLFRAYCLEHNLLDFSLQVELFSNYLWDFPLCRSFLLRTFHHLIADNIEEDTPFSHKILADWLPHFKSALLIFDQEAGYRRFLGADPESGYMLSQLCPQQVSFKIPLVSTLPVQALADRLGRAIARQAIQPENPDAASMQDHAQAVIFEYQRFYPQMLDWVAEQITCLVREQGLPPGEIAVLSPFLSDALRFSLADRLAERDIPARSHRPSRSLRQEPVTQCMLTLSALAHPTWGFRPPRSDVAYALMQAVDGLDLTRAHLLADIVYRPSKEGFSLGSFDPIIAETQERISYRCGERYERLRRWLLDIQAGDELAFDHFLSRLFGEVLAQPGYGFHGNFPAGEVAYNLLESVQKFRWMVGDALQQEGIPAGKEYLHMVSDGVLAAQFVRSWQKPADEAVLLAPAYTFLMSNRPVSVQFWLDVGSRGWSERLYQPLTHPYVLSRAWEKGRIWTEYDEHTASSEMLYRLARGLLGRCRSTLYLGLSEFSEQGYEERGPLLKVFQRLFQQYPIQYGSLEQLS